MKTKIGNFFMMAGAVLIIAALSLLLYNQYDSQRAGDAAETVLETLEERVVPQALPPEDMTVVEIDGYGYIGYLSIPALDLTLPVMDEWDYDRLKIAPCRYIGSVRTDDMVIAAHNYQRHFGPVRYLPVGTEVYFSDMDGFTYAYEITEVEVVQPTDIDAMIEGDDWDLTLFTCTYGGQTRTAVRCARTGVYETDKLSLE